jgi:Secretion system C-terminal sorting domain
MKKIYLYLIAVFAAQFSFGQSIFDNPITGSNPSASNPFIEGQTVDPNLTVSGIGRGSGISGTSAANRYNASGWTTATTSDAADYFEFVLTPAAAHRINFVSFVYTSQASGTGPTAVAFRSSLDGFTADIGTPSIVGTTIDLSGAAYQSISAAITFRFYAFAAGAAAGTFSINDFTFNGAVVPILLPVSITSFSGYRDGSYNQLQWTTGAENNNLGFDVQRSADGVNYVTIASVKSLAPGGNSTLPLAYSFTDNGVAGSRQYYRLRQVDRGGLAKLSSIAIIRGEKPAGLVVENVFPNPAPAAAAITVAVPKSDNLSLIITDINGRVLSRRLVHTEQGSNTVQLDLGRLSGGMYMLQAISSDGTKSAPVKLIKQ